MMHAEQNLRSNKKVVNGIYYVHFAGRFRIGAHARLTDLHFSLASLFGIYSWSKYRVTVNKRNKGNHFFLYHLVDSSVCYCSPP